MPMKVSLIAIDAEFSIHVWYKFMVLQSQPQVELYNERKIADCTIGTCKTKDLENVFYEW